MACRSCRLREITDVPKRLHDERYEDDVTQDHNTDSPFVPLHTQESNTIENEAKVWCAHVIGVKQNKRIQRHEDGHKWARCQTISRREYNYQ